MKHILRREDGTSLLELALILPIFLLLVLGTLDFGNGFNTYIAMANATREGALWIGSFPTERAGMDARIYQEVERVGLSPAAITISLDPNKPSYQQGDMVTLRIEHTYPLMFGAITNHASILLSTQTTTSVLND